MKELTVEITNESGLHARPATAFTQLAAKFASKVTIAANGKTADAKSILTVLTLGATKGTSVTLTADGADEDEALAALSEFLQLTTINMRVIKRTLHFELHLQKLCPIFWVQFICRVLFYLPIFAKRSTAFVKSLMVFSRHHVRYHLVRSG